MGGSRPVYFLKPTLILRGGQDPRRRGFRFAQPNLHKLKRTNSGDQMGQARPAGANQSSLRPQRGQ